MNLKKYTRADCRIRMPGKPSVNLNHKGPIAFNKATVEEIDLKDGDKILFVQDEQRPTDWYIAKTEDEDGFPLRKTNNSLITNAATIARAILKSIEVSKATFSLRMATEPTEVDGEKYYAILTKVPNGKEKLQPNKS